MTDLTRGQQGQLTELAGKKIQLCQGWHDRMLTLGGECDDDDAALIFSDVAAKFSDQAQELLTLLDDGGSSEDIMAALQRDQVSVLGTEGQYSEAAVFIVKEKIAAISDVEPWARQDDDQ